MGASESTGRLNQTETEEEETETEEEEEEERRGQREYGGGSSRAGAIVIATAGAAVAAWGISRIGRNETETEEERRRRGESWGSLTGAAAIAIAIAGAAVAEWGISRMRSDSEEKDETSMIRTHDQGANRNTNSDVDQTQTKYFGSGSAPLLGLYARTPQDIRLTEKGIWFPPPSNRVKMNTAGGFRPLQLGQPSGYAGILRDNDCKCIIAFRGFGTPGVKDSLEAQIIGILKGLDFLVKHRMKGAILENDSDQAVFWINRKSITHDIPKEKMNHCKEMIETCRKLARSNNIYVCNIDEDANECAHELARLAIDEPNLQTDLPDSVTKLVKQDKLAYNRNLSLK